MSELCSTCGSDNPRLVKQTAWQSKDNAEGGRWRTWTPLGGPWYCPDSFHVVHTATWADIQEALEEAIDECRRQPATNLSRAFWDRLLGGELRPDGVTRHDPQISTPRCSTSEVGSNPHAPGGEGVSSVCHKTQPTAEVQGGESGVPGPVEGSWDGLNWRQRLEIVATSAVVSELLRWLA